MGSTVIFQLLVAGVFISIHAVRGYHLNSTREEDMTARLTKKNAQFVGMSGEKLVQHMSNGFKCLLSTANCSNCSLPQHEEVLSKINSTVITKENLVETSTILLAYTFRFGSDCSKKGGNAIPCSNVACADNFLATSVFGLGEPLYHDVDPVENVLAAVKRLAYTPRNYDQCFSSNDLFYDYTGADDRKLRRDDIRYLASALALRLASGDCITLKTEVDFIGEIFRKYGSNQKDIIKLEGLEKLMSDIGIERHHEHEHDHEHHHNHDDPNHDHDSNHKHDDPNHNHDDPNHDHDHNHGQESDHGSENHDLIIDHSHDHVHDSDHDHSHEPNHEHDHDHDHSHEPGHDYHNNATEGHPSTSSPTIIRPTMTSNDGHDHNSSQKAIFYNTRGPTTTTSHGQIDLIQFTNETDGNRRASLIYDVHPGNHSRTKRTVAPHGKKTAQKNDTNDCWSADDLFHKFDLDRSNGLNPDEFLHICPALIQQRMKGRCLQEELREEVSLAEVYGYGTLTVFIVSLCSLLGVILMPIQNSNLYHYVMTCFIALAFGTLTGDALLHLIPEAAGLHTHDEGSDHDHTHGGEEAELPAYLWKFVAILAAIYGLFVVESISAIAVNGVKGKKEDDHGGHGHSHIPDVNLVRMATRKDNDKTVSTETITSRLSSPGVLNDSERTNNFDTSHDTIIQSSKCWGMTTLALIIIVGDGIHNIADGLTIGAAFSSSIKGGISSALAIFFHELPHEFGDFVILLSTGFSYKKALFWNFLSSLTAFVGLYIGIELGENAVARQWILAVAGGMFLYIALGDMLPELKSHKAKNGALAFLAQNVGILCGMIFMILLSVFEEKIKI